MEVKKNYPSKEKIIELLRQGNSQREIARICKISEYSLSELIKIYDIDWKSLRKRYLLGSIVYEIYTPEHIWAFNSKKYRDMAFDYCRLRGLNIKKSAAAKAETTFDGVPLPKIYERIKNDIGEPTKKE